MRDPTPRVARALLSALLPHTTREFLLGDLEERFRGLTRTDPRAARNWYRREALRALFDWHRARLRWRLSLRRSKTRERLTETLMHDILMAIRALRRAPRFSMLCIATLGLGVGAATAIFSVVNPLLLQQLPYPGGDRLVALWESSPERGRSNLGFPTVVDIGADAPALESVAATSFWTPVVSFDEVPERLAGQSVSHTFFRTLGVTPAVGRDFLPDEDQPGRNRVAIITWGLWQRAFGGDPSSIGRTFNVSGVQYELAGVLPQGFESLLAPGTEIWRPLGYDASLPWACRNCRHLRAVARLAPGASESELRAQLDVLAARFLTEHAGQYATGMRLEAVSLRQQLMGPLVPTLLALSGAVALVLVIACVNVANLLLARAAERRSEYAVRVALGAGRRRLAGGVVLEAVVLAVPAALLGVALAWAGVRGLVSLAPAGLPRASAIGVDPVALAFALVTAILTAIVFGAGPAFGVSRASVYGTMVSGVKSTRSGRARRILVMSEVALATALVSGAALMVRSIDRLMSVDPGFETDGIITAQLLNSGIIPDRAALEVAAQSVLESVRGVPGVADAAFVSQIPLGGNRDGWGITVEGRPWENPQDAPSPDRYSITPTYLDVMRIPLVEGRAIAASDGAGAEAVALVNQELARMIWGDESPIGHRVRVGGDTAAAWRTIIGVVGNVLHASLDAAPTPQIYTPMAQWDWLDLNLVVRSSGDAAVAVPAIRTAIRAAQPGLAIHNLAPLDALVRTLTAQRLFTRAVFQVFALVSLALAGAGIYGVLAGAVAERRREFGIRAAIGATRSGLLRLVLRDGTRLAAAGLAAGLALALVLGRSIAGLLYQTSPADPVSIVSVAGLLVLVALLAALVPALRAASVDPMEALRSE